MQVRMSQDDCQFILGNSISQIFARLHIFNTDKKNECERVIEMIKELSVGVYGLNESEIANLSSSHQF